jgi:putative salt-induced outer membrane protein
MNLRTSFVVSALLIAAPAFAAENEEEAKDPLEGDVKLGFLATSGNTDTSTLNTGFEATYTLERWTHKASGAAIYSEDSSVTTAEAYEAGWASGWDLTERDFLFGRLSWRKDRFGGFNTQFSQTAGYGRKILTGEAHTLTAAVGAGARQSEDQLGVSDNEFIFTGDLDYTWKFSETAEFGQTLAIEAGDANTYSESVTSVKTTLIGAFSLVASYTIRHNSDVPVGTEKKDTRTAISLQYDF